MEKPPVTQAARALRAGKVDFTHHLYRYEKHGGTAVSARELGVAEHCVVKTLVMENADANPLLVLRKTRGVRRQESATSDKPGNEERGM